MSDLSDEHIQRLWRLGEALTEEVRQSPDRSLTGAVLGQRVRQHDWSLLSDTKLKLATVLDEFAPELTVVGRAGADLRWGLELSGDAPDPDPRGAAGVPDVDWPAVDGASWERVRFDNFRSIRAAELAMRELTVLVGRNGVGKTNILDGIFRLSRLTSRKPAAVFSGRDRLQRVTGRWDPEAGVQLEASASGGWSVRFVSGNPYEPQQEPPFHVGIPGPRSLQRQSLAFTPLGEVFGGATFLHLDARQLARRTYSLQEEPFLRHDGMGLGPVLATIAQMDRGRLDRILTSVRALVPRVRDIRIDRSEIETRSHGVQIANSVEVDMSGVGWMPADQLSEGTLLAIGLHTVLSRPQPPRVLLLDDVDRGLHPASQRILMEQLQELASHRCRIVCTSHSPYVIDPLSPEAVCVVTADENGATDIHPLISHPEWSAWRDSMTPADFWQYVGDESWPALEEG